MKRISLFLVSLIICFTMTEIYTYADEPADTNALVELYYAELIKTSSKELLNEASEESNKLAEYYAALAKQNNTLSGGYSQLAEYYKAVANTNCICMINGTFAATGVCTCGRNPGLSANNKTNSRSKAKKENKERKEPVKTYSYDSYGYLTDGSMFVVKGKLLIKDGKYFVDMNGLHYAINEDDIVYGIEKIEQETGKAYRLESVEAGQYKHNQAQKDTKNYNLWRQLNNQY